MSAITSPRLYFALNWKLTSPALPIDSNDCLTSTCASELCKEVMSCYSRILLYLACVWHFINLLLTMTKSSETEAKERPTAALFNVIASWSLWLIWVVPKSVFRASLFQSVCLSVICQHRNGRIERIGGDGEIKQTLQGHQFDEVIDCTGKCIIPGNILVTNTPAFVCVCAQRACV